MLRKLLIAAVLAVPAAQAASSQIVAQQTLMPGVTYERDVQFTPHGPVVLDVVTAPKPDGSLYTLAPALSNNAVLGTEKLTEMESDVASTTTSVGVNGDFFATNGTPTGILARSGVLDSAPLSARSSVGITSDGTLTVGRVAFDGTWRGTSQRRQLDLNDPPIKGHTTLYTSAWGTTTPAESGVVEDVIGTFPPAKANTVLTGAVTQVLPQGGTPIPPGGAVLVSRGTQAPHLSAEAPVGTNVEVRLTLTPDWSKMASAIGGGPLLVAGGKAVFRAGEAFGDTLLTTRTARTAIAQLADGRILLVAAEGGGAAYSAGMTNYELALALVRLGAVTGMALGSGSPSGMAFDGTLLTRPASGKETPVSDALLLSYNGVYAAPLATDVVSPNGDGVDDTQTFTYKVLRPSQVTATLTGPGGATVTLAQDAEQPGVHTLTWNAQPVVEGAWKFVVDATDDQGRATSAERDFTVDDTLASLVVSGRTATYQLAQSAAVTVTVETKNGVVVASIFTGTLQPGPQSVAWNGKNANGSIVTGGPYQLRVTATNSTGAVSLIAPISATRK